ncbi:EXLDI protein [Nonomuraea sp. NPDC002799]
MPNKTVYVSDEDLPLYQSAQDLADGNLSKAISAALRKYIEVEEGREDGYEEIAFRVGPGTGRQVRFSGMLLAEWGRNESDVVEVFRVYRSRKDKFVVHRERSNAWRHSDGSFWGWRSHLGLGGQTWGVVKGESSMDVADSLEALRDIVPAELYDMLADVGDRPAVDHLDI